MRKLLIAFLLLAAIMATPLLIMRSQQAIVFIAHWWVDSFTDFRLELRNPELRPLRGFASAEEIHLYPKADDAPPLLSVLDFSSDLNAWDLYSGNLKRSQLSANQVVIYTSSTGQAAEPAPMQWLQYLTWLPETLTLDQLHVVRASGDVTILRLSDLAGHRLPGAAFELSASSRYAGEPLDIQIQLSAGRNEAVFTSLAMDAVLTAGQSDSRAELQGELRGTQQDFSYDLSLNADYREVDLFLAAFNARRDIQGALSVTAAMRGDTEGFTLSNARFVLDNMPQYGFEAVGTLQYGKSGTSTLNLVTAGEIDTTAPLLNRLPVDLRPLGRAQGNARVTGSLQRPILDRFLLRSENAQGLAIKVMGRLEQDASQNRLEWDLQGPRLSTLSHWTGPLPHETGPFRASGVVSGKQGGLTLEDLIVEAGSRDTVLLRAEGDAKSLGLTQELGLAAIHQARLDLLVYTPDSSQLAPYLDLEVPGGFEVSGSLQLEGSGTSLEIKGGKLEAVSSDITATATPTAGVLLPENERILEGLQSGFVIAMSDTSALSQFFARPVPVLGALTGTGKLSQYGARVALEDIELALQRSDSQLGMSGKVGNLAAMQDIRLQSQFSGIEARDLLMTALENFDYPRELGRLEGGFTLLKRSDEWTLEALRLETTDRNGPLFFTSGGSIGSLFKVPAFNLNARFHLRDPALLAALSGLRMNPASGQITLKSRGGSTDFSSTGRVGDTLLELDGNVQHTPDGVEKLQARLASPMVHLADLGLQAKRTTSAQYLPSEQIELNTIQHLENALNRAPRYKTDIAIDFTGIDGDNTNITSFDLHYTGEQQRYTLRRFTVAYDESTTEVRGIIDLNSRPPFTSLAVEASALPLKTLTEDLGIDFDISGTAYLRGGLSAQGASGKALLADLDGNIALALEDAVIDGAAYDVLATDLLAWFYSGAALEKSTYVDCSMAKFLLNDGIATSDSLYVETSKMVATGDARLDLAKQKMDINFTPRSKSRSLQIPSSIRLKGSFDDPSVTLSPVAAAFDAYAEVLTLVPRISGRLFGIKRAKKKSRPCQPAE